MLVAVRRYATQKKTNPVSLYRLYRCVLCVGSFVDRARGRSVRADGRAPDRMRDGRFESADALSRSCLSVRNLCIEAEQLFVQPSDRRRIARFLQQVRSPFDHFTLLSPSIHATVRTNQEPYEFLPLIVMRMPAERHIHLFNYTPNATAPIYQDERQALLIFLQGVNNVAEVFHRSASLVNSVLPLLANCTGCPPVELITPLLPKGFNISSMLSTTPQVHVRTLAPMPPKGFASGTHQRSGLE